MESKSGHSQRPTNPWLKDKKDYVFQYTRLIGSLFISLLYRLSLSVVLLIYLSWLYLSPQRPQTITFTNQFSRPDQKPKKDVKPIQKVVMGSIGEQRPKPEAVAYRGKPLPNVPEDLVIPGVLQLDCEEKYWVPQAPDVWFRPLLLSVSQGYFVNVLRVRRSGILSRHRHSGPVCATTLKGRWHYLEHDWWATEGSFAFEPPGDIHTLEVPDGVDEMITLFHVTGAYIYVDPDGKPVWVEDVFSKLQSARAHYEKVGLGAEYVDQFIR